MAKNKTFGSIQYKDLRDFIDSLRSAGELLDVDAAVSPELEMTAVCDAMLRRAGPALLFRKPAGYTMPVLGNLFGTPKRVALGMGVTEVGELRRIGQVLAALKQPEPPRGLKDAGELLQLARAVWDMRPSPGARHGLQRPAQACARQPAHGLRALGRP